MRSDKGRGMKTIWTAVMVVIIGLAACMVNVEPEPVQRYPLAPRNTWTYQRTLSTLNFRPMGGASMNDTTVHAVEMVKIIGQEALPGIGNSWKFLATDDDGNGVLTSYIFYQEAGDSLQYRAYTNGSVFSPRQKQLLRYAYGGTVSNSLIELADGIEQTGHPTRGMLRDSLTIEPAPVTTYLFPLTEGREWIYRTIPFVITKKVTGTTTISTHAGRFATTRIHWFWDRDADGFVDTTIDGYDYVGQKGLIKRSFFLKDLVAYGPNSPTPIGYFDLSDDFDLTSMDVQ